MSRKKYWSASRIDCANYCRMRYYLRYIDPNKPKALRLSAYAKGSLLHKIIEEFWNKLGTEEEVAKDKKNSKIPAKEKKKYFDTESFSKYAQGRWSRTIIGSEHVKDPTKKIAWRYEEEPWVIKSTLPKICTPLYHYLLEEGPPLYSKLEFFFELDKMRFRGFIDEVRIKDNKITIRDYKSGSPWLGEMKVNHDPQLTFYNIGLCSLCFDNKDFAKSLGLENIREQFMGNPIYIYPDFNEEFFMIEAFLKIEQAKTDPKSVKNIPKLILQTKRRNEHFFELIEMINGAERAVLEDDIYPERGRKCDICDMKKICEKELEQVLKPNLEDKKGNLLFNFNKAPYAGPININPNEFDSDPSAKQKVFDWRRKNPGIGRIPK